MMAGMSFLLGHGDRSDPENPPAVGEWRWVHSVHRPHWVLARYVNKRLKDEQGKVVYRKVFVDEQGSVVSDVKWIHSVAGTDLPAPESFRE